MAQHSGTVSQLSTAFQVVKQWTHLNSLVNEITESLDTDGSDETEEKSLTDVTALLDHSTISEGNSTKMDLFVETGLMPWEYIIRVLKESDGSLSQQTIVQHTGWSKSTVSRTLTEIEKQGHIVRIQLGREKIVYLPEAAPNTEIDTVLESHDG